MNLPKFSVRAVDVVQALHEPFTSAHLADELTCSTTSVSGILKSMAMRGWIVSVRVGANRKKWYRRTPSYGITAAVRHQQEYQAIELLSQAMSGWKCSPHHTYGDLNTYGDLT